jgi:hypothetical protein
MDVILKQFKSKDRVKLFAEVFTNEREVKAMLALIPLKDSAYARFLEPSCGNGNFLIEILRQKLRCIDKTNEECLFSALLCLASIYGIDICPENVEESRTRLLLEMTTFISERQTAATERNSFLLIVGAILNTNIVVGDPLNAASKISFCRYEEKDGSLFGTPFLLSDMFALPQKSFFQSEAPFNFDVIIGNPPYQMRDGAHSVSAVPLYHKFVDLALSLNPTYISFIIPARWYAGGKGLAAFRQKMLSLRKISHLVDFPNGKDCFPSTSIGGGVCYFLYDKTHNGPCMVTNNIGDSSHTLLRSLDEYPTFIRNNKAMTIIRKVMNNNKPMSAMVSPRNPFDFETKMRGEPHPFPNSIRIHSTAGVSFIKDKLLIKARDVAERYKVMISRATTEHAGEPSKDGKYKVLSITKTLGPREICTDSYITIGSFERKEEADNLLAFLRTKMARFLILQSLTSINITSPIFALVPVLDFSQKWNDEMLYSFFSLTSSEIDEVENKIKEIT